MSLSKEDVLNAIAEMSVMDVVELISDMEEKFGVSAAAAVAVAAPAAGGGEAAAGGAEEKTEFDVMLSAAGDKKVNVIKALKVCSLYCTLDQRVSNHAQIHACLTRLHA